MALAEVKILHDIDKIAQTREYLVNILEATEKKKTDSGSTSDQVLPTQNASQIATTDNFHSSTWQNTYPWTTANNYLPSTTTPNFQQFLSTGSHRLLGVHSIWSDSWDAMRKKFS